MTATIFPMIAALPLVLSPEQSLPPHCAVMVFSQSQRNVMTTINAIKTVALQPAFSNAVSAVMASSSAPLMKSVNLLSTNPPSPTAATPRLAASSVPPVAMAALISEKSVTTPLPMPMPQAPSVAPTAPSVVVEMPSGTLTNPVTMATVSRGMAALHSARMTPCSQAAPSPEALLLVPSPSEQIKVPSTSACPMARSFRFPRAVRFPQEESSLVSFSLS